MGKPLKRFDLYLDEALSKRSIEKSKNHYNHHRLIVVKIQNDRELAE